MLHKRYEISISEVCLGIYKPCSAKMRLYGVEEGWAEESII